MCLQLFHSKLPYIRGKLDFLFISVPTVIQEIQRHIRNEFASEHMERLWEK
jgi:hypothetical protein